MQCLPPLQVCEIVAALTLEAPLEMAMRARGTREAKSILVGLDCASRWVRRGGKKGDDKQAPFYRHSVATGFSATTAAARAP